MNLLHGYFTLRNQQAFQRLLDGGSSDRGQSSSSVSVQTGLSTSGGKSWNRSSALTLAMSCDVNSRDWLGRTVLHLACASPEPSSIEYVRLLLAHPAINVNLYDLESHWTALHRALYHGNLPAALLLLKRSDTDSSLKDLEGYTAFDLYNSTLKGTKPFSNDTQAELFTWGANRNAALGLGDSDDRTYPDQVIIRQKDQPAELERTIDARFSPIPVRQVQMSRLHTVVVTTESRGNLRVCGFGSGGRLGPGQHTQYSLKPLNQFTHTIVSVALGQDHTLALTKSGEVLSWGLNRFAQLGYVVESSSTSGVGVGRLEEPIQETPRKVLGSLKKDIVRGVAASKGASACWTSTEVFTWGTNNGQLGYDKAAQPVQILPRKVTKVTQSVIAISITDSAMACLLGTQDVVCIWNDRHFKINFPTHAFPFEIQPYRPPQAVKDAHIAKITSCDDNFAALSSNGELFTFTLPNPSEADGVLGKERVGIKPQRVWALRKKFSAVKDVALGSDGSIIICTESGHVFVRSRSAKSGQSGVGKAFKFHRMPYIQRVISVCANNTGAFGAIRVHFKPKPITVYGNTLAEDLADIQPYLHFASASVDGRLAPRLSLPSANSSLGRSLSPNFEFEDEGDVTVQQDVKGLLHLCDLLAHEKESRRGPNGHVLFDGIPIPNGADVMVHVQSGAAFPVHRVMLAARSSSLCAILAGSKVIQDQQSNISIRLLQGKNLPSTTLTRLAFTGCHAMSVLILLRYLYSDELLASWDPRLIMALEQPFRDAKVKPAQVKLDLQALARILNLHLLAQALESPSKRTPAPSIIRDMNHLFHESQAAKSPGSPTSRNFPLAPDVILQLADKEVYCHSTILRARSVFFACFFDEEDWTVKRWDANGTITIDMTHMRWRVMQFVLGFLCCGGDEELFDTLEFAHSPDDVLEFMFEVMAAANELLLDRLVLLCSVVILRYSNINNACYILADATHFQAQSLVECIQEYMTANMETLLESQMLDDMPPALIKQLSQFVRQKQSEKAPVSRSNLLVDKALKRQAGWLALQDIPQPIVRTNRSPAPKDSSGLPSPSPNRRAHRPSVNGSLPSSPTIGSQPASRPPLPGDDIFIMDDADALPSSNIDHATQPLSRPKDVKDVTGPVAVWKASSVPRVDMKTVMAEAAHMASSRPPILPPPIQRDLANTLKINPRTPQRERRKAKWPAESTETSAVGPPRLPSSPWRLTSAPPSGLSINPSSFPSPPGTLANTSSTSLTHAKETDVAGPISRSNSLATTPRVQGTQPGLGPIFIPSRQPSLKSKLPDPRSVPNGKAWTLPPVQPVVVQSLPSSETSFIAIQQLQQQQGAVPGRDKRPLREIQEEEQARQEEEEFLKWWSAEEERVRLEADTVSQPRYGHGQSRRKHKGPKSGVDAQGTGRTGGSGGHPRRPVQKGNLAS